MKIKELGLVIGLGFLLSPLAHGMPDVDTPQNTPWQTIVQKNVIRPDGVKELPLYELEPKPIPIQSAESSVQNFAGMAYHIFFQRTSHSLTLGARVAW